MPDVLQIEEVLAKFFLTDLFGWLMAILQKLAYGTHI
jgi:hypothetical protein